MGDAERLLLARQAATTLRNVQEVLKVLRELEGKQNESNRRMVRERIKAAEISEKAAMVEREAAMADAAEVLNVIKNEHIREICWQYYVLGNTVQQISETMGITYRTVQRIKGKALEIVRMSENE